MFSFGILRLLVYFLRLLILLPFLATVLQTFINITHQCYILVQIDFLTNVTCPWGHCENTFSQRLSGFGVGLKLEPGWPQPELGPEPGFKKFLTRTLQFNPGSEPEPGFKRFSTRTRRLNQGAKPEPGLKHFPTRVKNFFQPQTETLQMNRIPDSHLTFRFSPVKLDSFFFCKRWIWYHFFLQFLI